MSWCDWMVSVVFGLTKMSDYKKLASEFCPFVCKFKEELIGHLVKRWGPIPSAFNHYPITSNTNPACLQQVVNAVEYSTRIIRIEGSARSQLSIGCLNERHHYSPIPSSLIIPWEFGGKWSYTWSGLVFGLRWFSFYPDQPFFLSWANVQGFKDRFSTTQDPESLVPKKKLTYNPSKKNWWCISLCSYALGVNDGRLPGHTYVEA